MQVDQLGSRAANHDMAHAAVALAHPPGDGHGLDVLLDVALAELGLERGDERGQVAVLSLDFHDMGHGQVS